MLRDGHPFLSCAVVLFRFYKPHFNTYDYHMIASPFLNTFFICPVCLENGEHCVITFALSALTSTQVRIDHHPSVCSLCPLLFSGGVNAQKEEQVLSELTEAIAAVYQKCELDTVETNRHPLDVGVLLSELCFLIHWLLCTYGHSVFYVTSL